MQLLSHNSDFFLIFLGKKASIAQYINSELQDTKSELLFILYVGGKVYLESFIIPEKSI